MHIFIQYCSVHHLVQTAHDNSLLLSYGGQGSDPHLPSTKKNSKPWWFAISRHWFECSIHTRILNTMTATTMIWRHQVTIILSGPSWGTCVLSRNHVDRITITDMTNCTWYISVLTSMNMTVTVCVSFIFSSIHVTSVLISTNWCKKIGVQWETLWITTTTRVSIMWSSSSSRVH